jgi:hypothetical protein
MIPRNISWISGICIAWIVNELGLVARRGGRRQKKIGAGSSDLSRRFQPRLPGSVVGEASIGRDQNSGKITEVILLK